jgi:predicted N-acyltransferase
MLSEQPFLSLTMIKITVFERISEIPRTQWNQFVTFNTPFLKYEYLNALEESGAVSVATGWHPRHLKIENEGELIALMPLYLKEHSQGEYVFDQGWANAYYQNGLNYYPKWLTAIPFTPCQSNRILIKEGVNHLTIYKAILEFFHQQSSGNEAATWHCLFIEEDERQELESIGLLIRKDVQFKWFNRGYQNFDDYLQQFSARKRKNIKRERRRVSEQGIEFTQLQGAEISEKQWSVFFNFYKNTYRKYGMQAYLNLKFFKLLSTQMAEQLQLTLAAKEGRYVAAAFSLTGKDRLYGRYWGCEEALNNLHFETCYYQGIEYCIKHNFSQFDSGAQGEHKISRGFEPVITASAHWIKSPQFAQAIESFLSAEQQHVSSYQDRTLLQLPFKQKGPLSARRQPS